MLRDCFHPRQSDGVLDARALVHFVVELQALRREVERAASRAFNMAYPRYSVVEGRAIGTL
jgi:hypothetical protein